MSLKRCTNKQRGINESSKNHKINVDVHDVVGNE